MSRGGQAMKEGYEGVTISVVMLLIALILIAIGKLLF
jgi:hypothetical protein